MTTPLLLTPAHAENRSGPAVAAHVHEPQSEAHRYHQVVQGKRSRRTLLCRATRLSQRTKFRLLRQTTMTRLRVLTSLLASDASQRILGCWRLHGPCLATFANSVYVQECRRRNQIVAVITRNLDAGKTITVVLTNAITWEVAAVKG